MTDMEIRKRIDERVKYLEKRFAECFESPFLASKWYAGKKCFRMPNGHYFLISGLRGFGDFGAIVLEYADSEEAAKIPLFGEDGDLYYMEDYSEEEMFQAMLKEIKH